MEYNICNFVKIIVHRTKKCKNLSILRSPLQLLSVSKCVDLEISYHKLDSVSFRIRLLLGYFNFVQFSLFENLHCSIPGS